jgi:hypothetical protein
MFKLKFKKSEIRSWASRYAYDKEDFIELVIAPRIKTAKFATQDEFLALCEWKSSRPRPHFRKNSDDFIRATTYVALSSPNERLRIEVLTLLTGVSWPIASVILHWCHASPYPILDFRALWSLGINKPPSYDFDFWWAYTRFCRNLGQEAGVSMRVLDRALWQYSKENQKA